MVKSVNKYSTQDHLCRFCAGRILVYLGPAVTGGGNPVFECASCEATTSGFDPSGICWCGQHYGSKGKNTRIYMCYRIPKESEILPEERRALECMGFLTKDNQITTRIGVILMETYNLIISPAKLAAKQK